MPEPQTTIQVETAAFHGHDMIVIPGDMPQTTLVALKPIVVAMGLAWHGQFEKLKRNPVLWEGIRLVRTPSAGGPQNTVCLPLPRLNFWLATIDASRVRPELRATILAYQRDCADALYAHFFGAAEAADVAAPPRQVLTQPLVNSLAQMAGEIRLSVSPRAAARFLVREGVIADEDVGPAVSGIAPLAPYHAVVSWIAERLAPAEKTVLPNAIAYADFCAWAMANGQVAQTPVVFGKHTAEAGLTKGHSGRRRVLRGVALRARAEDAQ